MKKFGLIGYPLGHSFSRNFFNEKFHSENIDAEYVNFEIPSIDELPQFWNILKGEMSLVGTRPPTEDEFLQYEGYHRRRLNMTPGLTGLWQVSGRSDTKNFEEIVAMDVEYIDNWSLKEDIKILFKTVGVVLKGKGAS